MSNSSNYIIAYDCGYFLGDRPCKWHKESGVHCICVHYKPKTEIILLIKLDAMGDVLRTTCLLPAMAEAWPGSSMIWVTRFESVPLLQNNPYLTEVVTYGPDALVHLLARRYDRVVNLDAGKVSSGLAAIVKGEEKIGFLLNEKGYVTATNPEAENWLKMGIFDDLKQANRRTYQQIMCDIVQLPSEKIAYVLELDTEEIESGLEHMNRIGVDPGRKILGIHTGGGGRWTLKQWREDGFVELIQSLTEIYGKSLQFLLFGGPMERDLNRRIVSRFEDRPVYDTGWDNDVRHFAALIRHCDVVLSADSLAMHVALATGRRTVILFGPTSHAEIDIFGLGERIYPDLDCLVCYRTSCVVKPNCMDLITVEVVRQAVQRQLDLS